jgi:hypothetical protein
MGEYYRTDGCPIKCINCGSENLEGIVTDTLDGHLIMEYKIDCHDCGETVGYWAQGHFDPSMDPDLKP